MFLDESQWHPVRTIGLQWLRSTDNDFAGDQNRQCAVLRCLLPQAERCGVVRAPDATLLTDLERLEVDNRRFMSEARTALLGLDEALKKHGNLALRPDEAQKAITEVTNVLAAVQQQSQPQAIR